MKLKIFFISLYISFSCCSQEQKTADDIQQIAKLNFQKHFLSNKKTKRGKNDEYIYFVISQNKNFIHFLNDKKLMTRIIKDSIVFNSLFNKTELINYKNQLTDNYDIKTIENFVVSDSIRKKPIIDGRIEIIKKRVFNMMVPIFNINKNYAIFVVALEGNYNSLIIYKKDKDKWKLAYYYLIGIS